MPNQRTKSTGELSDWPAFIARRAHSAPLSFAAGFRHAVRKGVCCKVHSHEALEIVFHKSGSGVTRVGDGQSASFAPHDVVIYGPHVLHDQVMTSPGEDLCVQIDIPLRERSRLGALFCLPSLTDTTLVEEILSLAGSPVSDDPASQTVLDHRATAVLLALLQRKSQSQRPPCTSPALHHVRKAEDYMKRHYRSITSLHEVATHLGVTLDHLRHVFRRERKITLVSFLTTLRIDRAKFLLRNTGLPLKEIATLAGFNNVYYFSTVFRRQTAQSPAVYRREGPSRAGRAKPARLP